MQEKYDRTLLLLKGLSSENKRKNLEEEDKNMNKTSIELVAHVISKIGSPYWYGTKGEIAIKSLLVERAKMYPNWYTNTRIPTLETQIGKQVFDCAGLIEDFINTCNGNKKYDTTANMMYEDCKEKGTIDTIPDVAGVLVFYDGHVGVYIGDGYVVEARGFDYGVCKTALKARGWTKWGKHPMIDYTVIPAPTLKKTSSKADIMWAQRQLNKIIDKKIIPDSKLSIDGVYGEKTKTAYLNYARSKGWLLPDGWDIGANGINALNRF